MKATSISLFIKNLDNHSNKHIIMRIAEVCKFSSKEVMIHKDAIIEEYNISDDEIEWLIIELYHYECVEEEELKKEDAFFAKCTQIAKKYDFSPKRMMKEKEKISEDWDISKFQVEELISKLRSYSEFAQENFNKDYDKLMETLNHLRAEWWRSKVMRR